MVSAVLTKNRVTRTEGSFDNADFRRRSLQARERAPIVHDETCANHIRTPVHRSRYKGDLEQATQLILVLYARLGVHQPALVGDGTVASN